MDSLDRNHTTPKPTRAELAILLIVLGLGFGLRAWQIGEVSLDHYDEGVYAFSALGLSDSTQPRTLYPEQYKFSPPVYFSLVGLAYRIGGGPSDVAALMVNVLMGTLTILLVWWVGRRWFGVEAGVAAAALLALSEYHILLSRTVLTDVAFAFFFLLALLCLESMLQRQRFSLAVLAGLVVGVAWNTKYHGWFALVVAGAALVPFLWVHRSSVRDVKRFAFLMGVAGGVALACYLPWALYIQSQPGGYAAFAEYQRGFIDFSTEWFANLQQQIQNQYFLEGVFSRVSVPVALLCALLVTNKQSERIPGRFLLLVGLLTGATILLGGSGATALLALLGALVLVRYRRGHLATWFVLAWVSLWVTTAPLYHPYARLLLPFSIVSLLISGFSISFLATNWAQANAAVQRGGLAWGRPLVAGLSVLAVTGLALYVPDPSHPWRSTYDMDGTVESIASAIPAGSRVVVIGEPSLAFYLHLADRPAFERTELPTALAAIEEPVYVITGVYSQRAAIVRKGLEELGPRIQLLDRFPMNPKDVRVLDDFRPKDARQFRAQPDSTYMLHLYYLSSSSSTLETSG